MTTQLGNTVATPGDVTNVKKMKENLDATFLMKIAQQDLSDTENAQLAVFLKLQTSTVDHLMRTYNDAAAKTFKILETWLHSHKDVINATTLHDQLSGACVEIKRADLVDIIRSEQIHLLSKRLRKAKESAESAKRKSNEQIRLAKTEERQIKQELQTYKDEIELLNELVQQNENQDAIAEDAPEEMSPQLSRMLSLERINEEERINVQRRIDELNAVAKPVYEDEDKKLGVLRVASKIKEYEEPDLWSNVSPQFVKDGVLDMSEVLTHDGLRDLVYVMTPSAGTNITRLEFGNNDIFWDEETGCLLGAALASMSQLAVLRMPKCSLSDESFCQIADGLLKGCPQLRLVNCQQNNLTDAGSEESIKSLLDKLCQLTAVLTACGLSAECGHRLRMQFGVRFLAF